MSIGMTYEQFWYGDVRAFKSFVDADIERQKRKNEEFWLQGLYIYDAFSSALQNAFSKPGSHTEGYTKTPYPLFEKSEEEKQAEREEQEEKEKAFALAYMMQMVEAGKNWGGPKNS